MRYFVQYFTMNIFLFTEKFRGTLLANPLERKVYSIFIFLFFCKYNATLYSVKKKSTVLILYCKY